MIGSPAATSGSDVLGIPRSEQARFLNPTRDASIRTLPKKHGGRDSVEPPKVRLVRTLAPPAEPTHGLGQDSAEPFIRDDPDSDSDPDPDGQGFKLEPENSDPGRSLLQT
jgi:hypothetical protein